MIWWKQYMSKSQKRFIFKTEDWAKFFTDAYRSSYKHTLIGIAKLKTHDIYTSHKQKISDFWD